MADRKNFTDMLSDTLNSLKRGLNNINSENDKIQNEITSGINRARSRNVFDELDGVIANHTEELQKRGVDMDTPPFIANKIRDEIIQESKKQSPVVSGETASEKPVEKEKINVPSNVPQAGGINPQLEKDRKAYEEAKAKAQLLTKQKVRELAVKLKTRVFGQEPVIDEVVTVLKSAALNIKINKQKPAGCYLFAGPSGVGKTELAQSMADMLGVPILKINMGEYGLEQDVTKLIGTAKGYVGYQEGGLLTNFVKENPACIVLFDELEKAHSSIDKPLLSIMDHGICTDNKGMEISFKETIVISTSNLGAEVEYELDLTKEQKDAYRMEAIKEGLRPEIINRYDSIFHFASLTPEIYKMVTTKFLDKLIGTMKEEHNFDLKFTPKLIEFMVEKSFDPSMGGRPARKFIEKVVIQPLVDRMLEEDFDELIKENNEITMDLNKAGKICFKGKRGKVLGVLENTAELVDRIEETKFTNKRARP